MSKSSPQEPLPTMAELNKILAPYQKANTRHSIMQLLNTLIPYFILWYLMVRSLAVSYALTLGLAVIAGLFLVRVFIFFHDCGHNSFFPSKKANKTVGFWLGVLTFTPGESWWHSHAIHHATSGNLDKRGIGDVTTMTQEEYLEAKWGKRLGYAFFRNPLVMFGLGPLFMFVIMARLAVPRYGKKRNDERCMDEPGDPGDRDGDEPVDRSESLYHDPTPGSMDRRVCRHLDVLYPAPVRGHLLGTGRRVELRRFGPAGSVVLQAAGLFTVVHREHWLPPYPSSQPAHPELQPGPRPRKFTPDPEVGA